MKLKPISIAILLSSLPTSLVFAAGLDRSGQSIQAFYNLATMQKQEFLF